LRGCLVRHDLPESRAVPQEAGRGRPYRTVAGWAPGARCDNSSMPQAPQQSFDVMVATFNRADDVPIRLQHSFLGYCAVALTVCGE
jgi:hypothetical protein